MAIAEARARLIDEDLTVEAGATVEASIEVGPTAEAWVDSFEEYELGLHGLPDGWFALSTRRLRVPAGKTGQALLVISPPREDPISPPGDYRFVVELIPASGQESIRLPGQLRVLAPGAGSMESRLLQYLPALYRSDLFLARFLLIFQSIIDPIEQTIDNTHHYLDPGTTPASFLPWLAGWLGLTLDPRLSEHAQRELIRQAVELYRWKGTRRGLREEMRIRTGCRALIVENFDGIRLGQDASLGLNTYLGVRSDQFVAVTLATNGDTAVSQPEAEAIVEELKPAHVSHLVRTVPAPNRHTDSSGGRNG